MATLEVITTVINEITYPGGPNDEINVDFGEGPQTFPRADLQSNAETFVSGNNLPTLHQSLLLAVWWSLQNSLSNPDLVEGKRLVFNANDPDGNILKLV